MAYFYSTTSPLTLLASSKQLEQAQRDVTKYEGKIKEQGKNGLWVGLDERNQYWKAKQCELPEAFEIAPLEEIDSRLCSGQLEYTPRYRQASAFALQDVRFRAHELDVSAQL